MVIYHGGIDDPWMAYFERLEVGFERMAQKYWGRCGRKDGQDMRLDLVERGIHSPKSLFRDARPSETIESRYSDQV